MNFIVLAVFLASSVTVVKQGQCPSSHTHSGGYCVPAAKGATAAVPKPRGQQCPSNWHQSGNYCVESK